MRELERGDLGVRRQALRRRPAELRRSLGAAAASAAPGGPENSRGGAAFRLAEAGAGVVGGAAFRFADIKRRDLENQILRAKEGANTNNVAHAIAGRRSSALAVRPVNGGKDITPATLDEKVWNGAFEEIYQLRELGVDVSH